jgi:predicted unusual protein kinase regulating ubiquinone biosynthesis (AarF/ABC1/UbiB family)
MIERDLWLSECSGSSLLEIDRMPMTVSPAETKELVRSYLREHPVARLRSLDVAKVARDLDIPVELVAEARESLLDDEHARLERTRRKTRRMRVATEGTDPDSGIRGGVPHGPWSIKDGLASLIDRMRRSRARDAPIGRGHPEPLAAEPKASGIDLDLEEDRGTSSAAAQAPRSSDPSKVEEARPEQGEPDLIRPIHDPKLIEALEEKLGPVVAIDQAPAIYGVCQRLLVDLAPFWQAATAQSGTATVLLVDSPLAVAHVETREARGVDVVSNTVCLSTGLVRNLLGIEALGDARLKPAEPRRLAEGVKALAGVIAQRLACAVKTVEKTADPIPDYQWAHIEPFWADARAAIGLRDVGLDPEAVHLAVRLFDMPAACYPSGRDPVFKGWLAHPSEKPLREASLELLFTRLEAESGAARGERVPGVERAAAMIDELRALTGGRERAHLETFESLPELVDQGLLSLFAETDPPSFDERSLLFNRRLLDLLDRVAEAGRDLSSTDAEALRRFLQRWIQLDRNSPKLPAWSAKDAAEKFRAAPLAQEYVEKPTYTEQLKALSHFKSEGHVAWCREALKHEEERLRRVAKRAIDDRSPPLEPETPAPNRPDGRLRGEHERPSSGMRGEDAWMRALSPDGGRRPRLSGRDRERAEALLRELARLRMSPEDAIRRLGLTRYDRELLMEALEPSRSTRRHQGSAALSFEAVARGRVDPIDWNAASNAFGDLVTKLGLLLPPDGAMEAYGEILLSFLKELPADQRNTFFAYTRFHGPSADELKCRVHLAWLDAAWDSFDAETRLSMLRHRAPDLLLRAAEMIRGLPPTEVNQSLRAQYDRLLVRVWNDPQRLSFALSCAAPWDRVASANGVDLQEVERTLRAELVFALDSPSRRLELATLLPPRGSSPLRLPRTAAQWIDPATATRCLSAAVRPDCEYPVRELLLEVAMLGFAGAPKDAARALESELSSRLAACPRPISGETFCRLVDSVIPSETTRDGAYPMFPVALGVPARALERADLAPEESRELLAACYATPRLLSRGSTEELKGVAEALIRAGVVESPAHLLGQIYDALGRQAEASPANAREGFERSLSSFVRDLKGLCERQAEAISSAGELLEFARALYAGDPEARYATFAMPNDADGRELRATLARVAPRFDLALSDRLEIFLRLTLGGSCPETDRFYVDQILPLLAGSGRPLSDEVVNLHASRLVSEEARVALARAVVAPKVAGLEAALRLGESGTSMQAKRAAFEVANRVGDIAHHRSVARDELLEEIAWRLELDGKVLRGLVHERKSRGRHDPELFFSDVHDPLRSGFHFTDYVAGSSREELEDFLAALVSADPGRVRQHFRRETARYLAAESWRSQRSYDDAAAATKEARLSTPLSSERLAPILAVLRALERTGEDRSELIRSLIARPDFLALADDARAPPFLTALLDTLPTEQQIVALARLLADRASVDDLRSSLVDLGATFGLERALSCRLLGLDREQPSQNPRGLFAPPFTRWELCSTAERALAPAEWGRVASLISAEGRGPEATHVRVTLKGGAAATLTVRTPWTARELEKAAGRRRAFLDNLAARGVEIPPELMRAPALPDAPSEPVTLVELSQGTGSAAAERAARTGLKPSARAFDRPRGGLVPTAPPPPLAPPPKELYAREIERIEQELGPVLAPADAPVLQAVLERLFAEAIPGQERALDRAFIGQLFVVDSTIPTAFTQPIKKTGSMESLIFITTGLLRQLMGIEAAWESAPKDAGFSQIEAAMHWAAGITEHELKHAVYRSQNKSRANRFETSQAEEIEVDSRAAFELYVDPSRSARATGVLEGLASLKRAGGTERGARLLWRILGESVHSHPETEGRMVFQRLLLTGLRIELGPEMEKGNLITPEEASAMVAELRAQRGSVERESFVFPKTIPEATQRLEALLDNQPPKNGKPELEFNRFLLALDELLRRGEQAGQAVTPADKDAIHQALEAWSKRRWDEQKGSFEAREADRSPYRPFDHRQVRDAMTGQNLSAELSRLPCHAVSLARRAFYRSEDHLAWCERRFVPALKAILDKLPTSKGTVPNDQLKSSELGRLLMEIALFMPPDRAAALFGETVLDHPSVTSSPLFAARVIGETLGYTSFGGIQPRLFMQIAKRAWPGMSRKDRAEFLATFSGGLFPVEGRSWGMRSIGAQVFRELFQGPDQKQMRADYDWLFREIWADKELFALTAEVPWEILIERLPAPGLAPDQARGRIRNGARAVLGGDHSDPAVKKSAEETFTLIAGMERIQVPKSSRFWIDKSLIPYFMGEKRFLSMSDEERKEIFGSSGVTPSLALGRDRMRRSHSARDRGQALRDLYGLFSVNCFEQDPQLYRHYFIDQVARAISRHPDIVGDDPKKRLYAFGSLIPGYIGLEGDSFNHSRQHDLVAEAVVKASLPQKTKAELLENYYLHSSSEGSYWRTSGSSAERTRILEHLTEHGVFESAAEAVVYLREAFPYPRRDLATWRAQRAPKVAQDTSCDNPESYFELVEKVSDPILAELHALDRIDPKDRETLLTLSGALDVRNFKRPPPKQDSYEKEREPKPASTNSSRLRALKAAVSEAMAAREDLDFDTKVEMFRAITSGGPTRDTDQFFLGHILPVYADRPDDLKAFLDAGSVYSHKTRLTLVKQVLAPRIDQLESLAAKERDRPSENLRRAIFELFSDLEKYVPDTSYEKDQYLESLGIQLGLRGKDLKGLVEDRKSFNWRRPNPALVNLGTAVSGYIKTLVGKERESFLRCLMNPTVESVRRETQRISEKMGGGKDKGRGWLERVGVETVGEAERKIETLLLDASPLERIPLIALTLDTGDTSFSRLPGYPMSVISDPKLLGWDPESLESILLRSYLESVNEHEVSASLAYLLAHKHESSEGGKSSQVKRLFLVFQTVGIKLGQAAAIFSLFGPRIAKEVDDLKDQARDVSLHEAYQALDEAKARVQERLKGAYLLPAPERALLEREWEGWKKMRRIVAPLGSASGKSVWQVELTDGRVVAMALRRSRIDAQITGNTQLLSRFLDKLGINLEDHEEELEKRGLEFPTALVRALVRAFEKQLSREFDFAVESRNIEKAAEYFARMDEEFAKELRGDGASEKFKLSVPRVLGDLPRTEDILFMELADGSTLAALERRGEWSCADHPELGEVMVGSCLRGFFREGRAFPDQHKGNWILSGLKEILGVEGRELFALDFGQYEEMQTARLRLDDRVMGAMFLEALPREDHAGNPEQLVEMAARMSRNPRAIDRRAAAERIRQLFARHALKPNGEAAEADAAAEKAEKSILSGLVTETLKILAQSGFDFEDRFLVGFFKGLMVLYGERYVDDATFRRILGAEIERLMRSHPAAVAKLIQQRVRRARA